jgi:hypothetical protein
MFMPSFDDRTSGGITKSTSLRGVTAITGFTPPPSAPATAENFLFVRKPPPGVHQRLTWRPKKPPTSVQELWPTKVNMRKKKRKRKFLICHVMNRL